MASVSTRPKSRAARSPAAAPALRAPRPVYDAMKADILSLALQPGQDLDEVSLSRRYGVSRTPIREALIRLAAENLVTFGQGRRALVTPLILADYPRFIEALDLTRRAVSRLAAYRHHEADLAKLRCAHTALVRAMPGMREGCDAFARVFTPLEAQLHITIAEAGHNAYLTRSYEQLLTVGHRMLHIPYAYDPRPGEPLRTYAMRTVARQSDLIGAIEAGDADGAEAEAGNITSDLVARLRCYFEENLAREVSVGSPVTSRG
jgi:DNA-binding GntR family transcriptional regulator